MPVALKIFIGIITFPFYTLAEMSGLIPLIIYKALPLLRNNSCG